MLKFLKSGFITMVILLLMTGCVKESSSNKGTSATDRDEYIKQLENENFTLKTEIDNYKEQLQSLRTQMQQLQSVGANYVGYDQKYRLITNKQKIYWMPTAGSPTVCSVDSGYLVNVIISAYNTSETDLWLYVNVPVFDTPANNRGWIREADTEKYTKDNQSMVIADVYIKKGTVGKTLDGQTIVADDYRGRIEKRDGEKVLIFFGGGNEIWFNQSDVVYPEVN